MHTFRFVWKRSAQQHRWYVRNMEAASLAQAEQQLVGDLQQRLKLKPTEFDVDHFVQEFDRDGQQCALHSLARRPRDYQVFFDNKSWPAGSCPQLA